MDKSAKEKIVKSVKEVMPSTMKTAVWLIKITVSISAAILLLRYFNILPWFSNLISPVFNYVGLPGEASLAFVSGYFVNVYSAIAVIGTLDLDVRSITILGIMVLTAHNMITETAVQKKTGSSALRIVIIRTFTAFILGFVLNLILPGEIHAGIQKINKEDLDFMVMLREWLFSTIKLIIKMVVLITSLSVMQRLLSEFGVIRWVSKFLKPVMAFFGLPADTAFLWIVANILGLAYGAAIMMEETESGQISKEDADLLNQHIAVSHSNLEDVLLMGSVGAMMIWLIFVRWAMSFLIVWEYRLETSLRKKIVPLRIN